MSYERFVNRIQDFLPKDRIYTDELRRLVWGTDASFYRFTPQVVVRVKNEAEMSKLLATAREMQLPVTFRAAGTSLSGQTASDSILLVAGKHWENYSVQDDGMKITLQPGIIGERVNQILKPYGRKFAPDPASVKSAMVGGIVINNASGMNCGTHANSDKMLISARLVFADGTILDTADETSREVFKVQHPKFIEKLEAIRQRICSDPAMVEKIQRKYAIKNVTGLNLRPFVAYTDPFEIIAHLIVGSEGTLAFLSEVTMKTERDYPFKASAMLYFSDLAEACRAVVAMKPGPVYGAELLDKKSLSSVNDTTGPNLTAVLTETMANTQEELDANIQDILERLKPFKLFKPARFTDKPEEYQPFWNIRAGIFPAVGGTRKPGTSCLIEDVAFPIQYLPEATVELQEILAHSGYDDACIYGHALEGNYHFIINQNFDSPEEIARYERLMDEVIHLVVDKYDGSLKAEHGTGRNMAPFVAYEWGEDVFAVMREVKALFDPKNLLNPGVIFNDDPKCHIKHLKPLPLTNPLVDKCIECGFCEVNCLTCGFTLSSRQRIIARREISRLESLGTEEAKQLAKRLQKQFRYPGNQTCAGDGLCSTSCPMGINVGELTHWLREQELPKGSLGYWVAGWTDKHLSTLRPPIRLLLGVAHLGHCVLGTRLMSWVCRKLHTGSGKLIPLWTSAMPKAYHVRSKTIRDAEQQGSEKRTVVYFPSCINQTFGTARHAPDSSPLVEKTIALLKKAGYRVVFPKNMANLCCGTIWESKGIPDVANQKSAELQAALLEASKNGKYPVLCDQSPCLHRMRETIKGVQLYEPVEFITKFLVPRLKFKPIDRVVTIHITCSTRRMGLGNMLIDLAKKCSTHVVVPEEIGCCGFAGDKGFTTPEVNAYALRKLKPQLEMAQVECGYSNSRTCEVGLTTNTDVPFESIIYLVDECTETL